MKKEASMQVKPEHKASYAEYVRINDDALRAHAAGSGKGGTNA